MVQPYFSGSVTKLLRKRSNFPLRMLTRCVLIRISLCADLEKIFSMGINCMSLAQAAQALFMNHTRNTIWRRIIRVCMGFSTRYP